MAKSGIVTASNGGQAFAPLFPANQLVAMIGALVAQVFALSSIKKTILVIFGANRKIWVWDDDYGIAQDIIANHMSTNNAYSGKIQVTADDVPTVSKVFSPSTGSWNVTTGAGYPVLAEPMKSLMEQLTKPQPKVFSASGLLTAVENANQSIVGKSFIALISQHTPDVHIGLMNDNDGDLAEIADGPDGYFGTGVPLGCLEVETEAIVVPTTREFWEAGATING